MSVYPPSPPPFSCSQDFKCMPMERFHPLSCLPFDTSTGLDKISAPMLKSIAQSICSPLSLIFNSSLSSGTFPADLKNSLIIPRLGEAFQPLRPWPELKSAFLAVVRQTRDIRMAVANVASVRDLGDRPNQSASFNFAKWKFGQSKPVFRSVQPAWLTSGPGCITTRLKTKRFVIQ